MKITAALCTLAGCSAKLDGVRHHGGLTQRHQGNARPRPASAESDDHISTTPRHVALAASFWFSFATSGWSVACTSGQASDSRR